MTLANGSALPGIPALTHEGEAVDIAAITTGTWAVVLLYRGHW